MLEVHDEIALIQFAEVDLRAIAGVLFGAMKAPASVRRGPSKQFGGRKK